MAQRIGKTTHLVGSGKSEWIGALVSGLFPLHWQDSRRVQVGKVGRGHPLELFPTWVTWPSGSRRGQLERLNQELWECRGRCMSGWLLHPRTDRRCSHWQDPFRSNRTEDRSKVTSVVPLHRNHERHRHTAGVWRRHQRL